MSRTVYGVVALRRVDGLALKGLVCVGQDLVEGLMSLMWSCCVQNRWVSLNYLLLFQVTVFYCEEKRLITYNFHLLYYY